LEHEVIVEPHILEAEEQSLEGGFVVVGVVGAMAVDVRQQVVGGGTEAQAHQGVGVEESVPEVAVFDWVSGDGLPFGLVTTIEGSNDKGKPVNELPRRIDGRGF
jgi:hypothetical protein